MTSIHLIPTFGEKTVEEKLWKKITKATENNKVMSGWKLIKYKTYILGALNKTKQKQENNFINMRYNLNLIRWL